MTHTDLDYDKFIRRRKFYYKTSIGEIHTILLPTDITWDRALEFCSLEAAKKNYGGYVKIMLEVIKKRTIGVLLVIMAISACGPLPENLIDDTIIPETTKKISINAAIEISKFMYDLDMSPLVVVFQTDITQACSSNSAWLLGCYIKHLGVVVIKEKSHNDAIDYCAVILHEFTHAASVKINGHADGEHTFMNYDHAPFYQMCKAYINARNSLDKSKD